MRIAAIDIGTNSIHMVIARATGGGSFEVSANCSVLSQRSKGGVPRTAMGSKPMSDMHTASVVTGFSPATITPGATPVSSSRIHGPSPPVIVRMPSTMAR